MRAASLALVRDRKAGVRLLDPLDAEQVLTESDSSQPSLAVEHTLDQRAADYINQSSTLVKSVAMLVQTPEQQQGLSSCENYANHAIQQTVEHPALQALVQLRLDLISNVHLLYDIPTHTLHALLLDLPGLTKTNAIHFVINILVEGGEWKSVVAFFDIGLATGTAALDFALSGLIGSLQDRTESWKAISRLHDKELAALLTLEHVAHWDVDTAVEMLFFCRCHLTNYSDVAGDTAGHGDGDPTPDRATSPSPLPGSRSTSPMAPLNPRTLAAVQATGAGGQGGSGGHPAAVSDRIDVMFEKLKVYAEILRLHSGWQNWQQVEFESGKNPRNVKNKLVEAQDFGLARRWAALHGVAESEIEQNYLLVLLDTNETIEAQQVC